MRGWMVGVALFAFVGCDYPGSPLDPGEPGITPGGERHARFAGEWMVDQPTHALYEATYYTFELDGTVTIGRTCPEGYETGAVMNQETWVTCHFGDRWGSDGPATLIVAGACDDGVAREIVLGFPSDSSGNAAGVFSIEVASVGGQSEGWAHGFPEWRWVRCVDGGGCEPQFCW